MTPFVSPTNEVFVYVSIKWNDIHVIVNMPASGKYPLCPFVIFVSVRFSQVASLFIVGSVGEYHFSWSTKFIRIRCLCCFHDHLKGQSGEDVTGVGEFIFLRSQLSYSVRNFIRHLLYPRNRGPSARRERSARTARRRDTSDSRSAFVTHASRSCIALRVRVSRCITLPRYCLILRELLGLYR